MKRKKEKIVNTDEKIQIYESQIIDTRHKKVKNDEKIYI